MGSDYDDFRRQNEERNHENEERNRRSHERQQDRADNERRHHERIEAMSDYQPRRTTSTQPRRQGLRLRTYLGILMFGVAAMILGQSLGSQHDREALKRSFTELQATMGRLTR